MIHKDTRLIVVTGPESTGKTELARALATFLDVPLVPEYAREYLFGLDRKYVYSDLREIAIRQKAHIDRALAGQPRYVIADTYLLVIRIWSEYRFGKSDPWIDKTLWSNMPDLFLLCRPDIPWFPDTLRENPHDRPQLFTRYKEALDAVKARYGIIQGDWEERRQMALEAIKSLDQGPSA